MDENNKRKKISLSTYILSLIIIALLSVCIFLSCTIIFDSKNNQTAEQMAEKDKTSSTNNTENEVTKTTINVKAQKNIISNFDLSFLKIENQEINKIYSPLSIKYALKMLEEGTSGDSKTQISKIVGNISLTKYNINNNIALANALFINNSYQNSIKQNYITALSTKYNAEVIADSFESVENINTWLSNKTLNLINNGVNNISPDTAFLLVNALGIDMEWEQKFFEGERECHYYHEDFFWAQDNLMPLHDITFNKIENAYSGIEINASINNYDIITELGEDNIRQIVSEEFRKWANGLTEDDYEYQDYFDGDLSEENIEKKLSEYLDGDGNGNEGYMAELASNYKRVDASTDMFLYVDEDVKVFAKDLKEYEGTTLQYVGIMPINEELDEYIEKLDETKINTVVNNLKELKPENFKQGVITKITGHIPKFKFEYQLDIENDLKQLGVTNIFEEGKANLTEIIDDENVYIEEAIHKANIEFTEDGIKASATTQFGAAGGGTSFDYIFEVPVEEIDITFDKPYMFLIRDKNTGEVWFMGTVYEPLLWEDEPLTKLYNI